MSARYELERQKRKVLHNHLVVSAVQTPRKGAGQGTWRRDLSERSGWGWGWIGEEVWPER